MDSIVIVCHPTVASKLKGEGKISILSYSNCGPLGLRAYRVRARYEELRDADLAERYRVILPTAVLDHYSLEDLTKMFSAFLQKTIRAQPQGYDVVRFQDPEMTHIYPMYGDDYLYAGKNERKLLFFDPVSYLGLLPLFLDRRCWNYMYVEKPLIWGGSAVLHSEDLQYSEEDIELTRSTMNYAKRMELRENIEEKIDRVKIPETEGAQEKLYHSYMEKWNAYDEAERMKRLRQAAIELGVNERVNTNARVNARVNERVNTNANADIEVSEESGHVSSSRSGNGASPIREL